MLRGRYPRQVGSLSGDQVDKCDKGD